jgi:mannose-6-phosphate isomerase-like protein (cupin superfamily)
MKSEKLAIERLAGDSAGSVIRTRVLPGEIREVSVDFVSVKGEIKIFEKQRKGEYFVLLSLKGKSVLEYDGARHSFDQESVVRIPYDKPFSVSVDAGNEFHFLLFRKELNNDDLRMISKAREEHSLLYIKPLSDCPVYTEKIKSSKTLNRMILPVGLVPRFCMGTVETTGPDSVGAHEHPMLDQHFIGMKGCKCIISADNETLTLTENMIVHIPLGSRHSVSVNEGDMLSYIWCDFFFTLKGENFIEEQHKMED